MRGLNTKKISTLIQRQTQKGGTMHVKVLIKRDMIAGKEEDFLSNLKNLRIKAMNQKGYISGETLICVEDTNKVTVISLWETLEDWNNWKTNKKRIEIDDLLNELQEKPTEYEPYVYSKYWAAASLGFPRPIQEQKL